MVTIGAVAQLIDFKLEEIDAFITQRFTRGRDGDAEIIEANIKAVRLGVEVASTSGFKVGQLEPADGARLFGIQPRLHAALVIEVPTWHT